MSSEEYDDAVSEDYTPPDGAEENGENGMLSSDSERISEDSSFTENTDSSSVQDLSSLTESETCSSPRERDEQMETCKQTIAELEELKKTSGKLSKDDQKKLKDTKKKLKAIEKAQKKQAKHEAKMRAHEELQERLKKHRMTRQAKGAGAPLKLTAAQRRKLEQLPTDMKQEYLRSLRAKQAGGTPEA